MDKIELPYNLNDIELLFKMVNDLQMSKSKEVKKEDIWQHVGQKKDVRYSYAFNALKLLGLIDMDYGKAWLTTLGASLAYVTGEKRNALLAKNLPEIYSSMLKWIYHSDTGAMTPKDMQLRFVTTYGNNAVARTVLESAINTFMHYCHHISLAKYSGRGSASKAEITEFGRKVLDGSAPEITLNQQADSGDSQRKQPPEQRQPSKQMDYSIQINTPDRSFEWDIKAEGDLAALDIAVTAIKEDWARTKGVTLTKPKSKE